MALCGAGTVADIDREPGAPGAGVGAAMTTVAGMLAAARRGRPHRRPGRERALDLARGGAEGAAARRAGPLAHAATVGTAHRRAAAQRPRVPLLAQRRRAGRRGRSSGINPTRRGEALAADVRATDCAMIVTDAEGAALLEGLALGVDPERILVVGTPRYDALLARFAGGPEAQALLADADAGRRGRAVPLDLHLGHDGGAQGGPVHPGAAGRHRRGGGARLRLHGRRRLLLPDAALPRQRAHGALGPVGHGRARPSRCGRGSARRPSSTTCAASAPPNSATSARRSPTSWPRRSGPTTPTTRCKSAFGTEASVRDRDRFRKRFGCFLIEGYGQSEGGAAVNPVLGMPKGALGQAGRRRRPGHHRAPRPARSARRPEFDAEGRLLNAGAAIGEIVNRSGRGSFEGYYHREDAEAERLRNGWYWTGDLGYVDRDGFFYFAGRSGDWLRVDSENFAAGPSRRCCRATPTSSIVAIYPVPDTASGAGDQVMLALELVPGSHLRPRRLRRLAG